MRRYRVHIACTQITNDNVYVCCLFFHPVLSKSLCHTSLEELEELWGKVLALSAAQRKCIANTDNELHAIEEERAVKVRDRKREREGKREK